MKFLYWVDDADNLFPSIHCLVSWFCYIGIRGRKEIPKWYQNCSCATAIIVFLSTLTTKQHVIVDIIGGVVIAELTLFTARKTNWYCWYMKIWEKITMLLFGVRRKQHEECEKEYI